MPDDVYRLWLFLPLGYVLSVLLETPVLLAGLSRSHSLQRRLIAGLWLTACTYPIVILVLPLLIEPQFGYNAYVGVAEVFAPLAECVLFWLAYDRGQSISRRDQWRDMLAIVIANLTSWLVGAHLVDWLWLGPR